MKSVETILTDGQLAAAEAEALCDRDGGDPLVSALIAEVRQHRALGADELVQKACRPLVERIVQLERNLAMHRSALRLQRERFLRERQVDEGEGRRATLAELPTSADDDLDAREQGVLRALTHAFLRTGRAPTYREIAAHLGIVSTGSVSVLLGTLQRLGYLRKGDLRRRRQIVLQKLPTGFLETIDPIVEEGS